MIPRETLLAMVQRHVREGEVRVEQQRDLVQHLKAIQSSLTDQAITLLTTFVWSQDNHERHLAQLYREIELGQRDVAGSLLA